MLSSHLPMVRGSGEGWTSDVVTCVGRSQLLKQNNNNIVIPCSQWLPLATTTFFGLLRPQFKRPHSTTRPNAIRTTYSSRLTRTVKHCSVGCVRLARQQGLMAARRIVLEVDLDKAPWSVSHLRLRLTAATAIPSRRALYPLQTHRSLFSTTSLHQCRHAATR